MEAKSGFLLIALAAFTFLASAAPARAAANVSACMDLTAADTNYVLNRSLVDENVTDQGGWCIGILADNITFDCQGYVIANSTLAISGIFSNRTSTTIMNCNVSMNNTSGGNGIELVGANNSYIFNNTLNNQYYGLYLDSTHNTTTENNTANSNSVHGIFHSSSSNNTIANNVMNSNSLHGILLSSSSNNTIANNVMNSNSQHGIRLAASSNDNTIINNAITSNNRYGIFLAMSSSNTLTTNNIWNCSVGGSYSCILVYESDYNVFDSNKINKSSHYGILIYSLGSAASDNADHNVFKNTNMTNIDNTAVFLDDDGSDSENLNNTFINFTYNSETVDSRSELIRKWHYRALVTYPSGESASGITVEAYNSSGILVENLTSGISGWTPIGSLIEYVNSSGTTYYYSNYTINATHPDFVPGSEEYNVSFTLSNLSDVITLGNLFSYSESSSQGRSTWSMGIADLDNDGFLDYIAGNFNQQNSIYINDGNGSFTLTESSAQFNATYSIAVGDLDNDGFLDYIAGNYNQPNNVYMNDGTGSFSLSESTDESNSTRSVTLADLNNDGYLDYIAGNSYQPNQIYINNGTGNFNILENSPESEGTFSIAIADLNSDGYQDYIAGNYDQPDRIYINNGSGSFASLGTTSPSDYTRTISVADINNDGHIDYISGNGPTPKGNDRVYINNGSGYFTLNSSTSRQDRSYGLAIADLNNDGDLDFITGNAGPGYNRIYLKDGNGNFSWYENSLFPNTTNSIAIADLNNDGNLDYIVGNTGENHIYLNNKKDDDYVLVLVKGTGSGVNRDGIGTRVDAYYNGGLEGTRLVTAADSSQDGSIQLHFGLASGNSYDINATFTSGKIVSCAVLPPANFTLYQNGSSTNGVSCYVVDFPPDLVLMQPDNFHVTSDIDVNFSCLASDDNMLSNISIYIWNSSSEIYYTNTRIVTGTSNQSIWFLASMTPDMYIWNCLVSDNTSRFVQGPYNHSLRIQILRSLFVKLVINNTDNIVYIPGVGETNSSALSDQVYSSPPHFYLTSHLDDAISGLVFSMRIPRLISVEKNASGQTHSLSIDQDFENSRVFLVFTQGNWRVIESRMALIEAGRFLTNVLPSFSYGLGNRYSLDLALGYLDIDLQGKLRLLKGTHKIVIENNGTSGGKPVVVISRE